MMKIYVVYPHYGAHEGYGPPESAHTTRKAAEAAIPSYGGAEIIELELDHSPSPPPIPEG